MTPMPHTVAGVARACDGVFIDWDVSQGLLFPATARDCVPDDHPVHDVRPLVAEKLDLSEVWADYGDGAGRMA